MSVYYLLTTLGRPYKQETLIRLHPEIRKKTTMVLQHHEARIYDIWEHYGLAGKLILPPTIDNLGPTRQHLLDTYRGEKIVMLDDDLTFLYRKDPPAWHLGTYDRNDALEPFQVLEEMLENYTHASISGREGNNHVSDEIAENVRYMRVLGYNTANFPRHVRMDRVNGMSDFDTNLQLLRAGHASGVNFWYAQGQGATQQPGGCSLNRTHDTHSAEIKKMTEMHPGLVRVRLKQNKGGGEFGTREELTIAWKKAYGYDNK